MKTRQSLTLFLLLSVALVYHVKAQGAITCTAGYHMPGNTATITCHFHGQVSTEQNTGVYITRYRLGDKDDSGKEVLMCHFSGGSVSVCNPEPGYRFINFNKNNLTIEVPDVASEFQGRYSCGVVPADSRKVHPCLLVVKEPVATDKPMNLDLSEREDTLHARVGTTHGVVIFILILMMVAAAAVIYMVIAHKKNLFPFKEGEKEKPADPEPALDVSDTKTLIAQESASNPSYRNIQSAPASDSAEASLLNKKQPMPQGSGNEAVITTLDENADKKKEETDEERKEREETDRKVRESKLQEDLNNATNEKERKRIQKKFNENENRLEKQKEEEEKRLKKQKAEEEKRLKKQKEEAAKRLKQEKKDQKKNAKNK